MNGNYAEAKKLWDNAKDRKFSYEKLITRQYSPRNPADPSRRIRLRGIVEVVKPGYVLIQPDEGPVVLSKITVVGDATLHHGQTVSFEPSFSAKGVLAENLEIF